MLAPRQANQPVDPAEHLPLDPRNFDGDAAKEIVRVTPKAVEMAKKALRKRGTPDAYLRLGVRGGGCSGVSYAIEFSDKVRARDNVYDFDGLQVLVDPKSLPYIDGTELDFVREGLNEGFKFHNPNEKDRCGCGESFNV